MILSTTRKEFLENKRLESESLYQLSWNLNYLLYFAHSYFRIVVGLRCGFEGGVTTSVEFKSVPRWTMRMSSRSTSSNKTYLPSKRIKTIFQRNK